MYPKARIEALTDGIFAVAMTILILDVRLPEDFHPADSNALLHAIEDLWPKFVPYLISFFVLGNNWLANIQLRSGEEFVTRTYAARSLLYLFLATCLPFSTTVLGRFGHLAPAVWLYAFNLAALSALGYRLITLMPDLASHERMLDRKVALVFLMVTSALSVVLSFFVPSEAMWVYLLNILTPHATRWASGLRAGAEAS
jgi:uncharacterized membrane protein